MLDRLCFAGVVFVRVLLHTPMWPKKRIRWRKYNFSLLKSVIYNIFISAGRAGERPFGCRRMIHMFLCVSAPHLKCLGRRSRPVRRSLSRSSGLSPTLRPSLWHRPRSSASGHFGLAVRGVSATMSNAISSDATLSSVLVFDCIDSTPRVISPNISISTTAIPNNKIFLLITIVLFFEFICPAAVHPVVILVRN